MNTRYRAADDIISAILDSQAPVETIGDWPISEAAVRIWADLMGYPLPAPASGEDLVVPRPMLYGWMLRSPGGRTERPVSTKEKIRASLSELGFSGVVATRLEQRYLADLHIGQRVVETSTVESVSEGKRTRLGDGYFVRTRHEFTDTSGQVVGNQHMDGLHFRPRPIEAGQELPRSAMKQYPDDEEVWPPVSTWVSATDVVAGAIATNDWEPVHHDIRLAQSQGLDDIIMNVLSCAGRAAAYVASQAGPGRAIASLAISLHAPVYPNRHVRMVNTRRTNSGPVMSVTVEARDQAALLFSAQLELT